MAIVIPSKKIYDINSPRVLKNVVKRIELNIKDDSLKSSDLSLANIDLPQDEKATTVNTGTFKSQQDYDMGSDETPKAFSVFQAIKANGKVANGTVEIDRETEEGYILQVRPKLEIELEVAVAQRNGGGYYERKNSTIYQSSRFVIEDNTFFPTVINGSSSNYKFQHSTNKDVVDEHVEGVEVTIVRSIITSNINVEKVGSDIRIYLSSTFNTSYNKPVNFIKGDTTHNLTTDLFNEQTKDFLTRKIQANLKENTVSFTYQYPQELIIGYFADMFFTPDEPTTVNEPKTTEVIGLRVTSAHIELNALVQSIDNKESVQSIVLNEDSEGKSISISPSDFLKKGTTLDGKDAINELWSKVGNKYINGKSYVRFISSVGDFYNENGDKVISTDNSDKMLLDIYDQVVVMKRNEYGQDEPIYYDSSGKAKVFDVVSVKPYFDGALWQEVVAIEASDSVEIPTLDKLPIPTISVTNNILTINDSSGKAERFEIFVDGSSAKIIDADAEVAFDLSTLQLGYGTFNISVISRANNYIPSASSNSVSYTIENPTIETLPSPFLTIDGDTLYIFGDVENAESFDILVNNVVKTNTTNKTYNLKSLNLGIGTYLITAIAKAKGFNSSPKSESVTYTIERKTTLGTGKYQFNDIPDLSQTITQSINAQMVIGGETHNVKSISISPNGIVYTTETRFVTAHNGTDWISTNLKQVEVVSAVEVTTTFYSWFFENVEKVKLSFTIEQKSYVAESGMTWYQWCNSTYNIDNWLVKGEAAVEKVYRFVSATMIETVYNGNSAVSALDKVIDGINYTVVESFSNDSTSGEVLDYVKDNYVSKEWIEKQEYTSDQEVREIITTEVAQEIANKDLVNEEQVNTIVNEAIRGIEVDKYVTEGEFTERIGSYSTTEQMETVITSKIGELSATVNSQLSGLQDQIDGAISTWYESGEPTTTNEPAVNWITDEEKENRSGDLYYDNDTGYCYRWQKVDGAFTWVRISDEDVSKALQEAQEARAEAQKAKDMQIGGRNLAWYTGTADSVIIHSGAPIISGDTPLSHRWNLSKTGQWSGTCVSASVFDAGETYTISYFFQKTAGTLVNIGGDLTGFTVTRFSIDGKEQSPASVYTAGFTIPDDKNVHYVVVTVTAKSTPTPFWIQPNRGSSTQIIYDLWNIKAEKGEKATDWTPAWEEYYTTAETTAKITESANSIIASVSTSVDTKLGNYAKTTEMNSALALKADTASLSVYAKTTEVNSKISTVEGKLALEIVTEGGETFSRLLAKAGYMKFATNQLVIDSKQFTLDKSGNATFSGNLSAAKGTFSGQLSAATGSFSGDVTATTLTAKAAGNIAGWIFDSNSFQHGTLGQTNSMWLSNTGTQSTYADIAGSGSTNGWCLGIGNAFGVKKTGELFSNKATISGGVSINANSAIPWNGDGEPYHFNYTVHSDGTTCTVSGFISKTYYNVVIPSTIVDNNGKSYTVTDVGTINASDAINIEIPATVIFIQNSAFLNCDNLSSVVFAKGSQLKTIGDHAFMNTKLTSIELPSQLTSIGGNAFQNNPLETIIIPKSVTTIGRGAFVGCNNLSSAYYEGSSQQWANIDIKPNNGPLTGANCIKYYYSSSSPTTAGNYWKYNDSHRNLGQNYIINSPNFKVLNNGTLIAKAGVFAGQLSAATGTFAGELKAATGTFGTGSETDDYWNGTYITGSKVSSQTLEGRLMVGRGKYGYSIDSKLNQAKNDIYLSAHIDNTGGYRYAVSIGERGFVLYGLYSDTIMQAVDWKTFFDKFKQ